MVNDSHAPNPTIGSDTPDPIAIKPKPPAIRTMQGDLSNPKSRNVAKPPNLITPTDTPTPIEPQKDTPTPSPAQHSRIPEPPALPKPAPPTPPAIPSRDLSIPPNGVPPSSTPAQKPTVPAMTASLKPISPEHTAKDMPEETTSEDFALEEDELLSTEETVPEATGGVLDITQDSNRAKNQKPKLKAPKKVIIFAIIAVVLFAILGGGGYFMYSQGILSFLEKKSPPPVQKQTPPIPNEIAEETIPLTEPLIAASGTLTIGITSPEEARPELTQRILGKVGDGITVVYLTDAETFAQLPFTDAIAAAGIVMPSEVLNTLSVGEYTLFLTNEISNNSTRFGFVVEISDMALIKDALLSWEKTMTTDADQLLRTLGRDAETEAPIFDTNTRGSIAIRFINFPNPTLSLDYAIAQDEELFFLGTSRDNIFMALDAM